MNDQLLTEYISPQKDARVVVLFGGNPYRRNQVIISLRTIGGVSIYGTLSEAEGMAKLRSLEKVNLIVIGGRYTEEQRKRIRSYVTENMPATKITEPGYDYPYDDRLIFENVRNKLESQE